ncbi:MAG: type I restriction endonuclease subunit R [Candidatus Electrothrix sp. GM3_4]|nr:type I restriction endonuclease subunit R [Candidatus Electrothrix sp. GM3_4]
MTSKKELSERDICTKYIQPALLQAGWNPLTQIREEVSFTDGRIYVKGNLTTRGKSKRADYILYYKPNIPIAIIEAKNNRHSVRAGIQQGLDYAKILDIPSVYSSNGDGFYEHDRTCTHDSNDSNGSNGKIEQEIALDEFPSPQTLWQRYKKYKGIERVLKSSNFVSDQGCP